MSELFAKTAAHIDDICVIRSMYADVPNHEPSFLLMNTGESRLVRPSLGSWLTYGLGTENQNLPGFVAMCPGGMPLMDSQNWQAGLPARGVPGHLHRLGPDRHRTARREREEQERAPARPSVGSSTCSAR